MEGETFEMKRTYSNHDIKRPFKYDIFRKYQNKFHKRYCDKFRHSSAITSYGLIVFTDDEKGNIRFLTARRRDSISYIEFLKNRINETDMKKYISLMSFEEKKKCVDTFKLQKPELIWDDLWVNHEGKKYLEDKKRCCEAFMVNMKKYHDLFEDKNLGQPENEWGFPKGRKNRYENEIECAFREFSEETNMKTFSLKIIRNQIYDDLYFGSDSKLYRTIYFVAHCPKMIEIKTKKLCSTFRDECVSDETDKLSWDIFDDAKTKLNIEKVKILESIQKHIEQYKRRRWLT
jgi:8-oxo-dGTP pyrophosphatase MutT (NUDIX family)